MEGSIVSWCRGGFGFIRPHGASDAVRDVFVHVSQLKVAGLREPQIGERVSFDVAAGSDGRVEATNIRPAR